MQLREYLFRNRIKISHFAAKIDYGRTYINEIVNQTKKPGKHLAKLIERETNGEVTAEELINGE